ncbi:sll0787 family AIR synthase-like protein [Exilibacterium tricleocarpae]|nr:sll0787 family AIR synthase-like protein [Exilibacterium tricleocarpae]
MPLNDLLATVKQHPGIQQKTAIQTAGRILAQGFACCDYPNGDDAAVIKTASGYELLATEGFMPQFVHTDPWFAGWCGLMVNISDIAAMGGSAVAVVNSIWGKRDDRSRQVLQGMVDASHVFRVPIVGGHTNLAGEQTQLAVSILGRANRILSSFTARAGQQLVVAIDLRGEYRQPFLNWNAATTAPPERLRGDLSLLPYIAENNLATAAKDISQAGILGTCVMLLESSGVGASIRLQDIPKPAAVEWQDWLCSFPSFGYILATDSVKLPALLKLFADRDISAAHIGNISHDKTFKVSHGGRTEIFWNIGSEVLTGMSARMNLNEKIC